MNSIEILDSIYYLNGKYYTNIMNKLDSLDKINEFCNVMLNYLKDNELRIVYDDNYKDDSKAFILYKKNDKLLQEYISKLNGKFIIVIEAFSWYYPYYEELNNEEIIDFRNALMNYSELNIH